MGTPASYTCMHIIKAFSKKEKNFKEQMFKTNNNLDNDSVLLEKKPSKLNFLYTILYLLVNMYPRQKSLKSYWSKISRNFSRFSVQFSYLDIQHDQILFISTIYRRCLKWTSIKDFTLTLAMSIDRT